MSTIRNVYSKISSFENIKEAEKHVSSGSRYGGEEKIFWNNYEENMHFITDSMQSMNFPPDTYRTFYVFEPKLRKIVCSDYITKVIHRAAYDVLNPIICNGFISDTYSCVKGRGQLHAMQRLSGWVDYVSKSSENWYYLKLDVEKFFYRIDHEVLMKIFRKKVSDKKTVQMTEHYVCEASKPFGLPLGIKNPMDIPDDEMLWDVGISIGGGLSHMYGNMYMDPLDQFAKRTLGIPYYIRYADDIVVLARDKESLHFYYREFSDFLGDVLKLRFNERTAIRPISQGIEFVGFRIWPGRVHMRKSTALRMKRHLKHERESYRRYETDFSKVNATVMSYKALMDQCDCRALEKKIFDELVFTHNPKEAPDGRQELAGIAGHISGDGREAG